MPTWTPRPMESESIGISPIVTNHEITELGNSLDKVQKQSVQNEISFIKDDTMDLKIFENSVSKLISNLYIGVYGGKGLNNINLS